MFGGLVSEVWLQDGGAGFVLVVNKETSLLTLILIYKSCRLPTASHLPFSSNWLFSGRIRVFLS